LTSPFTRYRVVVGRITAEIIASSKGCNNLQGVYMHKKLVTFMAVCTFLAATFVGIQKTVNTNIAVDGVYDASPTPTLGPPVPPAGPICPPETCVKGVVTTYDASTHLCSGQRCWYSKFGAWWTPTAPKSLRWVIASKKECSRHPEWGCYLKDFGSYNKLVRPYYAKLTVYAAAGPELRKLIAKAYGGFPPLWHRAPYVKVRFWQILPDGTEVSNIIYIVDVCACERMADFAPGSWDLFVKVPAKGGGWHHSLYAEVVKP
jgi:hypothetical protein